ncbi:ESCRT-2 complex [Nadsonia fulvescens var. elongata DSM 6958]|uniref:Vacuolar-sorting protein SNF8 n=1 Tax=Nadsonia fulvescens var. elongata DSM 6958 TaxID=857566 RepID=A0A1E3PMR6_9ASCO|nr:ESCRT-2 complex [Nadsonia fulvescens var. elongata DSM 6958]
MKRGVGLAAFDHKQRETQKYSDIGATLLQRQSDNLNTQLSVFQSALSNFAIGHAHEIRTNAQFRNEFSKMCSAIGVDPLVSSSNKKSSIWASLLGKEVNDFYFQLAVKTVEICQKTRDQNGGLISIEEVRKRLKKSNSNTSVNDVEDADIERAIESMSVLGQGLDIVILGHKKMIRSVPGDLNRDHYKVLEACEVLGYVTVTMLLDNFEWESLRGLTVLDDMVASGLLWVDHQADETEYWAPSWID